MENEIKKWHFRPPVDLYLVVLATWYILVDFFTVRSGNEEVRCLNSKVRDFLFIFRELKATTTTTATKTQQICIFESEKQYFCTLCTSIFHLSTF